MNYKKINLYLGWLVFLIATIVYFITVEDTVSLWDCGEYITAAYKLEVGHPPGAPLFMVLGRIFSFFAEPENVAIWINRLSGLSSSLTILFMFWSISLLVKKIALKTKEELSKGDKIAILGSALVGSLAYTFTDSFWFSAVEGEVYAMASLFTAIIFWAILKWDEEMMDIQAGRLVTVGYSPDRWIILIMFMLGLAIGVHLLGILVIPAIAFVMYFRYTKEVDLKGIILVGILSVFILGFIQEGIIPGTISIASSFEVTFVNSFGLPFYSGTIFFFILLVAFCVLLIRYARKKGNRIVYTATMSLIVLLIGYSSFAVIVIRSNANPPLDENDPENLVTLRSYLKREQYGSAPIFFGPHWNSTQNPRELWNDLSPMYLRRFVVLKNDKAVKAFKKETSATEYSKKNPGTTIVEKYYESNAGSLRENATPSYAQTTFFPRMYWSQEAHRTEGYKRWSGYDANDGSSTEKGTDGNRLPTFGENLTYFGRYQVSWMYWRYFMWNFSGRQNDIQGHGDALRGNWITGISALDDMRLGDQGENAPYFTAENPAHNKFFLLPLILGFIGLVFHFYRAPKDAFVVFLVFLFTGLAIIVYLNQKPFEPRERDYAFAGSFYFFTMWIGIGAYALYDAFKSFGAKEFKKIGVLGIASLLFTFAISNATALTWLVILLIAIVAIGIMIGLRKVLKSDTQGAFVAIAACLCIPIIMGVQGWDDHDRSLKTSAHDLALNYLNSCSSNSILFTNGDNDTFPLWYMQEVEGKRTDVRVCNLSLMQTDWYTNQMKMKAYDSDPLPIKFREDQILMHAGSTDHVLFADLITMYFNKASPDVMKRVIEMRRKVSPDAASQAMERLKAGALSSLEGVTSSNADIQNNMTKWRAIIDAPLAKGKETDFIYAKINAGMQILTYANKKAIQITPQKHQAFQNLVTSIEDGWDFTYLADAMEFVRNDDNMVTFQGQRQLRVFPSTSFILPVNKENALKSGIITKEEMSICEDELKFKFTKSGISREQVMMLDILANNDWERAIYFSSPGGSEVSLSLLRGMTGRDGYVKQNGMAFELNPVRGNSNSINREKMYTNLMEVYSFGAMNNPDVLTDYYARRHTNQYRSHFLRLAEDYAVAALQAEMEIERFDMMQKMNPEMVIPAPTTSNKEIEEYRKRAIALIKRSLEVMPAEIVIDYGEPNASGDPRNDFELNGRTFKSYDDGALHEYVQILFLAGDIKAANELGLIVADQLESIIKYYEMSDVTIVTSPNNTKDLYAAVNAYFQLHIAAADDEAGDPSGILAKRTSEKIKYIYEIMYPSMFNRLDDAANANGESVRRGSSAGIYASYKFDLEDYSRAMAIKYGLIDKPVPTPQPRTSGPSPQLPQLPGPQN